MAKNLIGDSLLKAFRKTGANMCSVLLLLIIQACSAQSTSQSNEKVLKDVEETAEVTEGTPTTLAIGSGSAKGTDITIPAGGLEEGTSLSLDRVEQPNEFSSVTSSTGDGESSFVAASSAIEISASKNGQETTLAQPMTIAIPYDSSLTLRLSAVEKSTSNLCVLHKSKADGQLYVFVNELIQIDTSAKKAKFKTKTFGVFQMIFCGNTVPDGFKNAGDEGIAPEQSTFKLSVDTSTYNFNNSKKFCLLLITGEFAEDDSDDSNMYIISSMEQTIDGGSQSLEIKLETSQYLESDQAMIVLMAQESDHTCSYSDGNLLTGALESNQLLVFLSTIGNLNSEAANGTLGEGDYGLSKKVFVVGSPNSLGNLGTPPTISKACLRGETLDSSDETVGFSELNFSLQGSLNETFETYMPSQSSSDSFDRMELLVGMGCDEEEQKDNYLDQYTLGLQGPHSDGNYYLAPVSISAPSATEVGVAVGDSNPVCMEIYDGNFTNQQFGVSSNADDSIGRWKFTSSDLTILLPWTSSSVPLHDLLYHAGSDCSNSFPSQFPIVKNDHNLFQ